MRYQEEVLVRELKEEICRLRSHIKKAPCTDQPLEGCCDTTEEKFDDCPLDCWKRKALR